MKRLHFTLILSIFIMVSSFAQTDNGTNFITNSISGKLTAKSKCDLIYAKDGKIISSLVKDTLAKTVSYKLCNNYGTNATVSGDLYSLEYSKIKKIVFSDGFIKYYGISKFKNKKPQTVTNTAFSKRSFLFLSGGSNQFAEAFTEIGFLRQKTKNFAIGTSFSFMRSPYEDYSYYEYVTTYDYVGIGSGPYTSSGTYDGTAGYSSYWNGFSYSYIYDDMGPYNSSGNYIGTYGGYEENSGNQLVIDDYPQITSFNLFIDVKFSFLAKKRVQPFIISSYGGTLRSVGFSSSTNYYDEGFNIGVRIASGIDFFTKNNNTIFSIMTNLSTDDMFEAIFGARISFKL